MAMRCSASTESRRWPCIYFAHRLQTSRAGPDKSWLEPSLVIIKRRRWSIAPGQTIGKNTDSREALAARVIIPHLIDRPEVLFGDKFLQRLPWRNCRPRACLCVVAIGAARFCVRQPIHRWHILIGASHFHA